MLEIGNGGMTDTEYRTHMGLWALMSAPLIAGNDVRSISPSILAILRDPEVIAVDQDPLAFQAVKAADDGSGHQIWYKPLDLPGGRAVGLLNRGNAAASITVDWNVVGLAPGNATVRDLWARADRGTFSNHYNVSVPGHGLALLRIVGADRTVADGFASDQPWTYMANELGPVERDMSNGGQAAGDGRTITLRGFSYAKGLGAYAPSAIEFRPDAGCSNFTADIGVDDEVGNRGSVIFQVWGDGHKVYESGVMTGSDATRNVTLNITGVRSLRLELVAVDATTYDSADWANAQVTRVPRRPDLVRRVQLDRSRWRLDRRLRLGLRRPDDVERKGRYPYLRQQREFHGDPGRDGHLRHDESDGGAGRNSESGAGRRLDEPGRQRRPWCLRTESFRAGRLGCRRRPAGVFMVYPGDPNRLHVTFVRIHREDAGVLRGPSRRLRWIDLGRIRVACRCPRGHGGPAPIRRAPRDVRFDGRGRPRARWDDRGSRAPHAEAAPR